jgi:hypothetical protein
MTWLVPQNGLNYAFYFYLQLAFIPCSPLSLFSLNLWRLLSRVISNPLSSLISYHLGPCITSDLAISVVWISMYLKAGPLPQSAWLPIRETCLPQSTKGSLELCDGFHLFKHLFFEIENHLPTDAQILSQRSGLRAIGCD